MGTGLKESVVDASEVNTPLTRKNNPRAGAVGPSRRSGHCSPKVVTATSRELSTADTFLEFLKIHSMEPP
jgi:hypothetical protein